MKLTKLRSKYPPLAPSYGQVGPQIFFGIIWDHIEAFKPQNKNGPKKGLKIENGP